MKGPSILTQEGIHVVISHTVFWRGAAPREPYYQLKIKKFTGKKACEIYHMYPSTGYNHFKVTSADIGTMYGGGISGPCSSNLFIASSDQGRGQIEPAGTKTIMTSSVRLKMSIRSVWPKTFFNPKKCNS